jgi:purine nucleoside phosphorylase
MSEQPNVNGGIIGGSGTWEARFPEDFPELGLEVVGYIEEQDTPFGLSAPFKMLRYKQYKILCVGMHGCFPNEKEAIHPHNAAMQVAWVFKQAGVPWVLTGGSVGGIQSLNGSDLPPWSVLIPDDFAMWPNPVIVPEGRVPRPTKSIFYRLAKPFCPVMGTVLYQNAKKNDLFATVELGGVYVCTPWGRFETAAEIAAMKHYGWNVVGQTVGHEAIALRGVGIPVASLNIVSNFAESGERWIGSTSGEMAQFYCDCPSEVAGVIAATVRQILDEAIMPSSLDSYELSGLEKFPVPNA